MKKVIRNRVLLFIFAVCMSVVFADVMANSVFATSSTLTVSLPDGNTASLDILAKTSTGTFGESSNITVSVNTDNYTGYRLNISSSTDDAPLSSTVATINSLGTVDGITSAGITEVAFSDSSNTQYNNTWGYKPSKRNSLNNTNYLPAPSVSGDVLDETSEANDNNVPNDYTISIGARVMSDTPPGRYSNTFVITAIANAVPYAIFYSANGGSGAPANESTSSYAEDITISSVTPTKTGFDFLGWCQGTSVDNNITTTDGVDSCSSNTYSASGIWSLDQTSSSNSLYLYAMWRARSFTVTFKNNGGVGDDYSQVINGSGNLLDNNFTRSNYYFMGWGESSGTTTVTYRTGQFITPSSDMTLYAVWGNSVDAPLYSIVASLNHSRILDDTNVNGVGLSAKAGIKATEITKDNSGVFTYDSSTFGTSSDAANTSAIYLYRGVLDSDLDGTDSTYGSNGNSANYPNYVKLGNTCWRIFRTTGSGGIKMIYNGLYSGGTTANSCANAQTNTQVASQAFALRGNSNEGGDWTKNINRVGYTFNNDAAIQDSTDDTTSVDIVFGSNSTPSINNARSNIKTYIEDNFYPTYLSTYTSLLEGNAGYCNDRSTYSDSSTMNPIDTIYPFTTSDGAMHFGAYGRNLNNAQLPTLTCPRDVVDIYRYVDGNTDYTANYLKYPVALLTVDEASFAGSGSAPINGSAYNDNSFLRSGSAFWLLSPLRRDSSGNASGSALLATGALGFYYGVSNSNGVRPVISLAPGVVVVSGSGTATSPWEVSAAS